MANRKRNKEEADIQNEDNGLKEKNGKPKFIFIVIASVIGAFVVGLLIFNFIIMPWLVRQGQETTVPDVVGKPINEAKKMLLVRGFHLDEVVEVFDTLYPAGYVSSQKPKGGATAKIGRMVTLNVSKGQKMVQVPFVAKLSLEQARAILENLGLRVGTIESMPSNSIPFGRVITTFPDPASYADQGDWIKVQISSGPLSPSRAMPNLLGLTLNVAQETIKARNLILGEVKEVESDEKIGSVIVQYPEEGMQLSPGDTVRLIVAKPQPKPEPPPAQGGK